MACTCAGLGEYYRPQHPGADGPAFTLAGKLPGALAAADAALLPGPGYYEMPEAPGGAAFTIAGRVQAGLEQKSTPGPGKCLIYSDDWHAENKAKKHGIVPMYAANKLLLACCA